MVRNDIVCGHENWLNIVDCRDVKWPTAKQACAASACASVTLPGLLLVTKSTSGGLARQKSRNQQWGCNRLTTWRHVPGPTFTLNVTFVRLDLIKNIRFSECSRSLYQTGCILHVRYQTTEAIWSYPLTLLLDTHVFNNRITAWFRQIFIAYQKDRNKSHSSHLGCDDELKII